MITVVKNNKVFPFSKGILARSMHGTGLSQEQVYEIINRILTDIKKNGIEEIKSDMLREMVCDHLYQRQFYQEEKYYRLSRQIVELKKPMIVLIGGTTGSGKSSVALEVAKRLGINRVFNTDIIREIMRYMLPVDIAPTLHVSSFVAGNAVKNLILKNNLIYGFCQQSSLVTEGVKAYIKRNVKEGLTSVINGVHLVPGYLKTECFGSNALLFHYVLYLEDEEEHKQHFYSRSEGSMRDPEYYISNIKAIRNIQEYIKEMALKENVKIIVNYDFENTVKSIIDDIIQQLEDSSSAPVGKPGADDFKAASVLTNTVFHYNQK